MRIAGFLLAMFILAGCFSPEANNEPSRSSSSGTFSQTDSGTGAPASNASTPLLPSLEFLGCSNEGGAFSMPRDQAIAALPEGFEPVATGGAARPPDGVVLFGIAVECQSFAIDDVAGGPVRFAYAELAVTPAAAYKVAGLEDCTVPLAFIANDEAVGAALALYGLGQAGAGTVGQTRALVEGNGVNTQSFDLPSGGVLQFVFGGAAVDTLAVGTGDFLLYGVQEGQVVSLLKGTASGASPSAHYVSAMFQSSGIPALEGVQDAVLGFASTGFDLSFAPLPVPSAT